MDRIFIGQDDAIKYVIEQIAELKETIMAQFTNVQQLISAVNDKTNDLAADVGDCAARVAAIQQLLASSPTDQQLQDAATQLADVQSRLSAADDALKQIGANPQNPLP